MERLVDAVLFDLGNVLVRWDPFGPYEGRYPRAEVERFFADIDFMAFNHEQDAGRSWADAREALRATHPEHLTMLDVYIEHFADSMPGEMPGAGQLVCDVRGAGLEVFGLTNFAAQTFPVVLDRIDVVGRLTDVLVSGREGIAKPDPRVFRLAAERFGLAPARTLFVDDVEVNVAAAAACGFRAHRFQGATDLRAGLRALGVAMPLDAGAGAGPGGPGA